jgi:hypothetical protein
VNQEELMKILRSPGATELLSSGIPMRLAYTGTDGLPRVIPIGFHWDGRQIVVSTATVAPKVKALRKNPGVAMTIDTETFPPHVLLMRGTASIDIVQGQPAEFLEASHKLVPDAMWEQWLSQVKSLYREMARITITPHWAKFMDFETSAPQANAELARDVMNA